MILTKRSQSYLDDEHFDIGLKNGNKSYLWGVFIARQFLI